MHVSHATLKVLLVEDEPLIRWSISEVLTHAGHVVVEASDGATAERLLNEDREGVDVVLLDYRLPDSDDLVLLGRIRQAAPGSVVVMMTAFGKPDMVEQALEMGAYRVLGKPVDMGEIEPIVLEAHRWAHRS